MYKNFNDLNVIIELENLVKNCDDENMTTAYTILMKERILAVSGLN